MPIMVLGSAVDALCMVCVSKDRSFSFVCFLSLGVGVRVACVRLYCELVACVSLAF